MRFSAVLNFLGNKCDYVIFLIKNVKECPGSPVVVTLHFHCQGGWLTLIPQTVWCGKKKKKKIQEALSSNPNNTASTDSSVRYFRTESRFQIQMIQLFSQHIYTKQINYNFLLCKYNHG